MYGYIYVSWEGNGGHVYNIKIILDTVPGLMEHEAIPNISTSRRIGGKSGGGAKPGSSQKRMSITVDIIIREVSCYLKHCNMYCITGLYI